MVRRPTLRFLLDAGVPESVARALEGVGHEVIRHRDVLPERTKDDVVCATALHNEAILVAVDRDMNRLAKRYGVTAQSSRGGRFDKLSGLCLVLPETQAAHRVRHAMSLIEHEWDVTAQKVGRRLWIELAAHRIVSHR